MLFCLFHTAGAALLAHFLLWDGDGFGSQVAGSFTWNGKMCWGIFSSNLKLVVQSQVAVRGGKSTPMYQSLGSQDTGGSVQVTAPEKGLQQVLPVVQQCQRSAGAGFGVVFAPWLQVHKYQGPDGEGEVSALESCALGCSLAGAQCGCLAQLCPAAAVPAPVGLGSGSVIVLGTLTSAEQWDPRVCKAVGSAAADPARSSLQSWL